MTRRLEPLVGYRPGRAEDLLDGARQLVHVTSDDAYRGDRVVRALPKTASPVRRLRFR